MSLSEERLKAVYGVFSEGWKFLKQLLQEYPEFPQKPLTDEQWDEIVQKQSQKYAEGKDMYDEALFSLYRDMLFAASKYLEVEGKAYENKKN